MSFIENSDTGALEIALPNKEGGKAVEILTSIQPRQLHLAHYPQTAEHPGGHKIYQTLIKLYYWLRLAPSWRHTVRDCAVSARGRIILQATSMPLWLFTPIFLLEDVSMDLLIHLPPPSEATRNC